jgi:hypothetical protein
VGRIFVTPMSCCNRWNSGESRMICPAASRNRSTASLGSANEVGCLLRYFFLWVFQLRERHVDGVDLGVRHAQ